MTTTQKVTRATLIGVAVTIAATAGIVLGTIAAVTLPDPAVYVLAGTTLTLLAWRARTSWRNHLDDYPEGTL